LLSSGDNINGNWTYSYDDFGRLSAANCAGNAFCPDANGGSSGYTYAYDAYGNRWQQNLASGVGESSILLTFNNRNQVTSNTYDALGNVTNDGSYAYVYDAENRIISAYNGATTYIYDALGRARISYSSGAYNESVVDLQGNAVSVVPNSGGSSNTQGNVFIAGRNWGFVTQGGSMEFMHTDWLGNGRAWTSLTGSVYQTCQNLPFGDVPTCINGNYVREIFAGLWYEPEFNQYHAQFRQLAVAQAHWMTTDPAGLAAVDPTNPQTWNRYVYVGNNPLSFIDPLGLDQCPPGSYDTCVDVTATPIDAGFGFGNGGGHYAPFQTLDGRGGGGGGGWGLGLGCRLFHTGCGNPTPGTPVVKNPPVPGQQPCVQANPVQQLVIDGLSVVAAWTGKTVGYGVGLSGGAGNILGAAGGASQQLVVSPNGQAAFITTVGSNIEPFSPTFVGPTFGVGALGGVQLTASNATSPQQLQGPSLDTAGGYADGLGFSADVAMNGDTYQSTVTLGFGGGLWGGAIIGQQTYVTPVCGSGPG
jgi:RHS repeat-associated protein